MYDLGMSRLTLILLALLINPKQRIPGISPPRHDIHSPLQLPNSATKTKFSFSAFKNRIIFFLKQPFIFPQLVK